MLLQVSGISKKRGDSFALHPISFQQSRGEKIAIAGETGSGKTTLLKIIAGLIQPDSGSVFLEGDPVKGPEDKLVPGHSKIAYLSQQFEFPNHYRMEEILDFENRLPEEQAHKIYELCRISHLRQREAYELSGGERQRIALARQLVHMPALLLLDEPFSNLDVIHKSILKEVTRDLGEQYGTTSILVSHDPLDTLSWANRIIILKEGKMVQEDTPWKIYHEPVSEYAASLFGRYNAVPPHLLQRMGLTNPDIQTPIIVRPELLEINAVTGNYVEGIVQTATFWGAYYEASVSIGNTIITIRTVNDKLHPGDPVNISLRGDFIIHSLPGKS